MAKGKIDEASEMKKLLSDIYKIVLTTNSASKEQIKVNRELLKVMTVLNSGFAKNQEDARMLIDDMNDELGKGLELSDEFLKTWAKARGAQKQDLDELIKKFKELDSVDEDIIDNSKDYIDLLKSRYDLLDDEVDLTKKLLGSHELITKAVRESKRMTDKFGGSLSNSDQILRDMVSKKTNLSSMFSGMSAGLEGAMELVGKIQTDIDSMVGNVSGSVIDFQLKYNPLSNELDVEAANILKNVQIEKDARLDGLREYFAQNDKLQKNLARQITLQTIQSGSLDMPTDVTGEQPITPNIKLPKIDDILIGATIDVDTGQIKTATGILEQGTAEYEKLIGKLDSLASSNSVTEKMKVGFDEIVDLMKIGSLRTDEQTDKLNQLLKPLGIASEMLVEQIKFQYDDLDAIEAQVNAQKGLHKTMNLYLGQLQTAEKMVLKVGQGFDYINAILPVGISDFLGISKVSSVLLDSHQRGAKSFADEIAKTGDKSKALNSYLKQMEPAISLALNPMTILITSVVLLGTFLASVVQRYKDMASEMKISLMQAKQLHEVQLDVLTSQKNQFATMQDIQDIQTEMIGSSGVMGNLLDKSTQQLAINLVEVGKVFGYGNAEAVKLHKTFKNLGADDTLAQNLQMNLGYMAEMAGISPQIVSQDLIDSAETVSTYFAGMPDKAAKAVIQVRRMGMSLKQAGDIAQKMLDLEGFMTDMYELQAMSGSTIDFSVAFDKGLTGDIEGMTKEIMDNIGTTADYNKMDYLTRMKIAKTLGMSVDELGKSVNLHEKMNGMLPEQQKYLEGNLDRMGDISDMSQSEIKNRLEQLQSTDRLGVAWDKIKGVFIKALIPLAETFADAIDAISPLIDGIIGGFKLVGLVIKPFVPLIKGILAPFKLIGDIISGITTGLSEWMDKNRSIVNGILFIVSPVAALFEMFGGISQVIYGIGAAIGTWFIITKFTSVIGGIISMFGGLFKTIPLIGSLFGGIGKKSVDAVSTSKSSVDAMTSGVQSSMSEMVSTVKIMMGNMVKSVQESFKQMSSIPITPPVIEPQLVGVDKVKKATKSLVSDVAADVTQSTAHVEKVAKKAKESVEGVQQTTKKGFFKSDAGKETFKVIGALGASTFASLATKAALSFIPMEEGASNTLTTIAGMAGPLLGTAFSSVGTLLSDSLSEAFDRVTRKTIEKKLEGKFEGPLKDIRNKMGKLGEPATQSLETVGKTGTSIFDRLKTSAKNMLPTNLFKKTTIVDDLSNVDVKPMEMMGDTLQTVTDKVEQTQTVEEKVKSKKVKQIPTTPLETIDQTVKRKTTVEDEPIAKKIVRKTSKVQPAEIIDTKPTKSKLSSLSDVFSKGFDGIVDIVKKSWSTLKSVLLDIVDFAGDVLKSISGAVGESIKKLLTGIGDGLSSFKTSALKGAASLLVVSGALWVTSKALQNFAKVSWEDVGKGIVTLGGLTAAALALGKVAGQVLIGAAAIALLGASLIPAAYALNEFNKVNWSSLAKAGVALVGLGVIGVVMSAISAPVIIGSLAIAALGASLIPLAFALGKFNEIGWDSLAKAGVALVGFGAAMAIFGTISPVILAGSVALGAASLSLFAFAGSMALLNSSIQTLNPKPLAEFGKTLLDVTSISVSSLFGISAGLISLGAAMLTFQTMSSLGSGLSAIFGKGVVNDLEKLGNLADPLYIVANSIGSLVNNLGDLSQVLGNVDLTNVEKLKNFDEIGVDTKISRQIEPLAEMQDRTKVQRDNTDVRISPIQQPLVRPFTPNKESVAQNVEVQTPKKEAVGQNIKIDPIKSFAPLAQSKQFDKQDERDIYGGDEINNLSKIEMMLMRIAQMLEIQTKQTPIVVMDGQKVGTIQKKYNNS